MSEQNSDFGRPNKIQAFTNAFREVVNEDLNTLDLTEEELVLLTNEKLNDEDKICYSTFKNYKIGKGKNIDITDFLAVYKKAFIIQKKTLLKKLREEDSWQRYAWQLERKEKALNKTIIDYEATKGKEKENNDQNIIINKFYSRDNNEH